MDPFDRCAPPDLRHLRRLTNGFGILQHTRMAVPAEEFGYAIDDVARALMVVTETARLFPESRVESPASDPAFVETSRESGDLRTLAGLADLYLRFIEHCQLPGGRFHNFVAADQSFRDHEGSLDSYGRTVWALGVVIRNSSLVPHLSSLAERAAVLLRAALPHFHDLPYLRSKAFTLLGLLAVLEAKGARLLTPDSRLVDASAHLVDDLLHAYADAATPDWPWFEDALRYSNGALPYALLAAASNSELRTRNSELAGRARDVGVRSLDFLLEKLPWDGVPAPVGNQWWPKGGERALYDQQCVDAAAMVLATAEAFLITKEAKYRDAALTWWRWFFGHNTQKQALYRPEDGAIYDGLTPQGVNENRGAESVLAFLLAHLKLKEVLC